MRLGIRVNEESHDKTTLAHFEVLICVFEVFATTV